MRGGSLTVATTVEGDGDGLDLIDVLVESRRSFLIPTKVVSADGPWGRWLARVYWGDLEYEAR